MIRAPTIAPLPPERVQAYRSLRIALCAELPLHRRRPDEVQEPGEVLAQIGAEDRLAAVFVALDADGLPRGFASLEGRPGTRWGGALELDFGVAPTARRQGIGRALLAAAAAWAAERGAWRL
ncbi:MAG TPA: GNAT family N-acetyltransferase, partial [Alphaproteobacteria bacterium]|nr:GNAT family N-acetyltransferase [Alphaproteobacteria bacterium]